jgi:hypothetical protein
MHRNSSSWIRRTRAGLVTACAVLLTATGALALVPAQAGPLPTPTAISASVATDNAGVGGAVPSVLAEAGGAIQLTVTLQPAGSAFKSDTPLTLTPSLTSGANPTGSFSPASLVMPADTNSATFTISYSAADNGVLATVGVAKGKGPPTDVAPGTSASFDVLKELTRFAGNDPRLANGLGIGDNNCSQASTEPACGTLILSHGTVGSDGALGLGKCTPDLGCRSGSQIVEAVADLGTLYTPQDPAILIYRCDKKLCSGKGISTYKLKVTFEATGPLNLTAQPCVSKGVALDASGNDFCVDYVQSHRDNSGDALLYLLFTHDMRGST